MFALGEDRLRGDDRISVFSSVGLRRGPDTLSVIYVVRRIYCTSRV